MNFDVYQNLASRTADTRRGQAIRASIAGLGLAGEAGEVVELIKKHVGHGHGIDREKLGYEIGDVLWYLAEICEVFDLHLADCAHENIEKLKRRYPDGFSSERSINRSE